MAVTGSGTVTVSAPAFFAAKPDPRVLFWKVLGCCVPSPFKLLVRGRSQLDSKAGCRLEATNFYCRSAALQVFPPFLGVLLPVVALVLGVQLSHQE